MTKIVDLTRPLKVLDIRSFPSALVPLYRILSPEIDFIDHQAGAEVMSEFFGCTKDDLPNGEGWAEENLRISSHLGTHVDAPWHYGSVCAGRRAKTIDEIPLEELFCDAVVLDLTYKRGTGQAITIEDLKQALFRVEYQIKSGDAVLLRTDHDKYDLLDGTRYMYPGMTRGSALWLAEQGAKVSGTDAPCWDRPFPIMASDFRRTKNKEFIWDGHFAYREIECYIVQQLANLDKLPPHGFKVSFFPIPFVGASAAPTRAVAYLEDG